MFRTPAATFLLPIAALVLCGADVLAEDMDAARRCATLARDAERLACYDALFKVRDPERTDATAKTVPEVAESTGGDEAALRDFGLSEADKRQHVPRAEKPATPESITATLQSVARRPTGEQVLTTSDGQVWVEVEAYSRARPVPGETVVIRKAALGSFTLVTSQGIGTKVRRVK